MTNELNCYSMQIEQKTKQIFSKTNPQSLISTVALARYFQPKQNLVQLENLESKHLKCWNSQLWKVILSNLAQRKAQTSSFKGPADLEN